MPPNFDHCIPVTVRVPAKLNLGLSVGALREDGFHELRTVFHALDLYDTVTATPADTIELELSGPESQRLPADQTNLAWRAAELLAKHAGVDAAVRLQIDKRIPVAAGLAGGSADAAATLLACARLWQLTLGPSELSELAAQLGSDVNFALHGRSALGTGRGEQLATIAQPSPFHWVLAVAEHSLSTPAVYAEFDRQRATSQPPATTIEQLLPALSAGDPGRLAPLLSNDLQNAAITLAPYLADTLAAGRRAGALAGLVSGSGPTCAFLAADRAHARLVATAIAASHTCRYSHFFLGGVAGAAVIDPSTGQNIEHDRSGSNDGGVT